jgi:CelD/BcsL family acetyltransferase involved in cellulose biosynthesis
MKVSVVRPQELDSDAIASWRAMQRSTPALANPFLSPGFTLAAGRARPSARVAVLEDRSDVVGFLPFDQGRLRIGRPVAPGVSDCQAVIHIPGFEWSARDLLDGCRLDVWEFDHLIGEQTASAGRSVVIRSSPLIDVSDGYEAYLAERQATSKKILKSTLYKLRKLERNLGETHFEFDDRDPDALRVLMRWKSAQYRRAALRDRFAVDWVAQLIWDLFETRSDGCAGILSVLRSSDGLVAGHFGLRSEHSLSCWFPAYDISLGKYSPGLSLHLKMAEAAAADGIRYVDLGKGDEDYKQSLKSGDLTVAEGWIDRPSGLAIAHRVQRAPHRILFKFIVGHPRLRRLARRMQRRLGRMRSTA